MKTRFFQLIIALLLMMAIAIPSVNALADGIIIPDPPICEMPCPVPPPPVKLGVRYHHVTVTIKDQVAVTHVDQVFYNPNEFTVEGTYLFPIPADAAVSGFILWVDGKPVEGKVLDAQQARQIYEDIVRSQRDPALLEYAGRGAVQARIFPIPAQGERRVELEYTQALAAENGLVRYVYPLSTEKFSGWPLENVTISLDIRSSAPIRAVYSPTHNVAVNRENDNHVTVGYEESNVLPEADFALYYSLGETEAFHLLTFRDPSDGSDPDGFFLLLLAPRPDVSSEVIDKDIILVLDHSGSMEGEKFQQAQEAARYILKHLNPGDRFNLVAFSTGVESFADKLRPVGEVSKALTWVDTVSALGSTDINRALLEAAGMVTEGVVQERPTYLIFLTDGLPTEGVIDSQKILENFAASAPTHLRLFAFGVGDGVDTFLLDSLAQGHHGASFYVLPGERLDEILSSFYAKISTPVLTDLKLDFGGVSTYDMYPSPLPDLFVGSQIIAVGRYHPGQSLATITLTGDVNGQSQTFSFPEQVFAVNNAGADATLAALPRLWATRKIGYLLNQIRLKGPDQETIDQIVRLSIRYGIVTPYTSYLVTEPLPLGAEEQSRIAQDQFNSAVQATAAPPSGQAAVGKAKDEGDLAGAQSAAPPPAEAANTVRIVGSRAFVLSNGVWIDTGFDPQKMQTVKVAFLSEDYFKLAEARPELAAAFALGEKVIALSGGVAYEVVAAGAPAGSLTIPPTYTPTDPGSSPSEGTPAAVTPAQGGEPAAPKGGLPCLGGLLPLALLPLALAFSRKMRR